MTFDLTAEVKKPSKRVLFGILFLSAIIILSVVLLLYFTQPKPQTVAPPAVSKLTINAVCDVGDFSSTTEIALDIYDRNYNKITSVTLTAPTFTTTVTFETPIETAFFVLPHPPTGFYFIHDDYTVYDEKFGTYVQLYAVTSSEMSITLHFARIGTLEVMKIIGSYQDNTAQIENNTLKTIFFDIYFNVTYMLRNLTVTISFQYNETKVVSFTVDFRPATLNETSIMYANNTYYIGDVNAGDKVLVYRLTIPMDVKAIVKEWNPNTDYITVVFTFNAEGIDPVTAVGKILVSV